MAALAVPMKLDLSFAKQDRQNDTPGLLKETSTVGDLISFADLTKRQSPERRKSLTEVNAPGNARGRRRSNSFGSRFSRSSLTSPTKTARAVEYASPPPRRSHVSRRESMLNLLREDLQKIPCLEALQRHYSKTRCPFN